MASVANELAMRRKNLRLKNINQVTNELLICLRDRWLILVGMNTVYLILLLMALIAFPLDGGYDGWICKGRLGRRAQDPVCRGHGKGLVVLRVSLGYWRAEIVAGRDS